jgi:hypothetical protein
MAYDEVALQLKLVQWVDVSVQLEAPTSLSLTEECRWKRKVGGPQSQSLCIGVEEIYSLRFLLLEP